MVWDHKYGKGTFEYGTMGEDDPGFWFRCDDKHLLKILEYYAGLCQADSPQHHLDTIDENYDIIHAWQLEHGTRTPTSDHYIARKAKE